MNHTRSIIFEFRSVNNVNYLHDTINNHFQKQIVYRYLQDHLEENIKHFVRVIENELNMSDPLPGTTISNQVTCFNNQFIKDRISYIKTHIIKSEAPLYIVQDGHPTARKSTCVRSADDVLNSWKSNSNRGIQLREDNSGDVYTPTMAGVNTGIVFCDQRKMGEQQHYDAYQTKYMVDLNRGHLPHEETPFGVSTPAADARLLSRKIFRHNENGVENGIPVRESRLYNRNLDRNVTEGLRGAEREYMIHGHDMSTLRKRVDYKNNARIQLNKSKMRLHTNNDEDERRYS